LKLLHEPRGVGTELDSRDFATRCDWRVVSSSGVTSVVAPSLLLQDP
jgi:hypothetical protein